MLALVTRSILPLAFAVIFLMAAAPEVTASQPVPKVKRVFILNSFNQGYIWTDRMLRGIDDTLAKSGLNLETSTSYMDMKRIKPNETYFYKLKEMLKEGYRDIRFDILIACDNDALDFLRKYRDELFPGVPLVFSSINDFDEKMLDGRKDLTGTSENTDYLGTINLALKLRPDTNNIIVVSDETTTGRAHVSAINKIRQKVDKKVDFTFLSLGNHTLDELAAKLAALPETSIVLLVQHFKDKNGNSFSVQQSTPVLAERSSVPVFVLTDIRVGLGPIGGSVVSGYHHGEAAATMAVEVLKGRSIATIAVLTESPNKFIFDYNAMKRFDISEASLPDGNIVIKRPVSNFEKYRTLFFVSLTTILVLAALIIVMWLEQKKRRKTEYELLFHF